MTLDREKVLVPLVKGIDQGATDPKITDGGLIQIKNGVYKREGAISKRTGTKAVTGTITYPHMTTINDHPAVFGDGAVYTYSNRTGAATGSWRQRGTTARVMDVEAIPLAAGPSVAATGSLSIGEMYRNSEVLIVGNIIFHSYWYNQTTYYCDSRDATTGFILAHEDTASTQQNATRMIEVGDRVYFFCVNESLKLICESYDTTTGELGATRDLGTSDSFEDVDCTAGNANIPLDICYNGTTITVCYKEDSADNLVIGQVTVDDDTITGTSATVAATSLRFVTCCKWDTDKSLIVYYQQDAPRTINAETRNDDNTVDVAAKLLDTPGATTITGGQLAAITTTLGTTAEIYWTEPDGEEPDRFLINRVAYNGGDAVGATVILGSNCEFWCKPFLNSDDELYIGLHFTDHYSYDTGTQRIYILARDGGAGGLGPEAQLFSGTALEVDKVRDINGMVTTPWSTGTDEWALWGGEFMPNTGATINYAVKFARGIAKSKGIPHRRELAIPGACGYLHDGDYAHEHGFLMYPQHIDAATAGNSSSWNLGTGGADAVDYKAMYEWYDSNGNRTMSALSKPITVSVDGSEHDNVEITVPTLGVTHKDTTVRIVLYRSTMTATTIGVTMRRLEYSIAANDPTVRTIILYDNGNEPNDANEQEYTAAGAVLDHTHPPPYRIGTLFQNRMFVAHRLREDREIWYSKELIELESPHFNSLLQRSVATTGGSITALAALSDKLIIFKNSSIYATHGEGLSETGFGDGYADPYLVSETIGCTDQRTVAQIPGGLVFLSKNGINVLTRQMQISPIGRAVKYHTDTYTCTGAAVVPKKDHVIFTFSDGPALVYNYFYGRFSTFTDYDADGIVACNDLAWFKDPNVSAVNVEDESLYRDRNAFYSMVIETGWYSFAGLLGFQRCRKQLLLGQAINAHTLRIKTAYDLVPFWADDQTFDASTMGQYFDHTAHYGDGLSEAFDKKAYMVEFHNSRQKCTAIRFQISDEES